MKDASSKAVAIAAAAAIAVAAPMVAPEQAFARDVAPYAGLTPCKKNKAFAKREKAEIKALEKRLKKVSHTFESQQNLVVPTPRCKSPSLQTVIRGIVNGFITLFLCAVTANEREVNRHGVF